MGNLKSTHMDVQLKLFSLEMVQWNLHNPTLVGKRKNVGLTNCRINCKVPSTLGYETASEYRGVSDYTDVGASRYCPVAWHGR